MRYLDPATRKRPDFKELRQNMTGYVYCQCGTTLQTGHDVFEHWQQGHFDIYDEVKKKG
jgi:hypothetical protein